MIFIGSILSLELVWELTDLVNAFMALPNLVCLYFLRKQVLPYEDE
jgi:AGCS family alanine or glycine:cation symporter